MAYNNAIPQPTDKLKNSQADILNNFAAIQTLIAINHGTFGAGDEGKHKWVTFPVQGSAPAFAAGDLGLFSLNNATTAKNELYINKISGAGSVQIPLTASTLSATAAPAANAGGWSFLPSGLLLKFGSSVGNSGLTTVTPTGGPAFTQMLTVVVGAYSNISTGDLNFAVRLVDINSATTFRVYISSRTSSGAATGGFQFLAIGY